MQIPYDQFLHNTYLSKALLKKNFIYLGDIPYKECRNNYKLQCINYSPILQLKNNKFNLCFTANSLKFTILNRSASVEVDNIFNQSSPCSTQPKILSLISHNVKNMNQVFRPQVHHTGQKSCSVSVLRLYTGTEFIRSIINIISKSNPSENTKLKVRYI